MAKNYKHIVILCDGDFPTSPQPLEKLKNSDIIIACDGAMTTLAKNGFTANYIVGDIDTLSEQEKKKYSDIIIYNPDQETNDQTKAFNFAISLLEEKQNLNIEKKQEDILDIADYLNNPKTPDCHQITIIGATGKREDHTIGNISLLADYLKVARRLNVKISTITDYGIFIPIINTTQICNMQGRSLSIFAFDNSLKITSQGLEYQTENVVWDLWWKATLNKITKPYAKLEFSHSAKALLYFPF